jgi:hypothetical protein
LEAGRSRRAVDLPEWLRNAAQIRAERLQNITPPGLDELFTHVRSWTEQQITDRMEQPGPRTRGSRFAATVRRTSAALDAGYSPEFRAALRDLELYSTNNGSAAPATLDYIRDVFETLRQQIDALGPAHGLANDSDLGFMKRKASRDIDALLQALGATAYDRTGTSRVTAGALVAATLAISPVPVLYAALSEPRQYYYLGGLAGAQSRTSMLAIGLMRNPTPTWATGLEHLKERQLIWALPAVLYGGAAFAQAFSTAHPEDRTAHDGAAKADAATASAGFLIAVAVIEAIIFLASNHPERVLPTARKPMEWLNYVLGQRPPQATRFASGSMKIPTPPAANTGEAGTSEAAEPDRGAAELRRSMEAIRNIYRLGAGLTTAILEGATGAWEENTHGPLNAAQKAQMSHVRQLLGKLGVDLDNTVGQILGTVKLISERQEQDKRGVMYALVGTAFGLGFISTASAFQNPALLTDYGPYYATAIVLILAQYRKNTYTAEDIIRTFGAYFGGTVLGVPPSLLNLGAQFRVHDGFFDIVASGNDTATPQMRAANAPALHWANGKVNFGAFVTYSMLTNLIIGGQAGQYISDWIIKFMPKRAGLNEDLPQPQAVGTTPDEIRTAVQQITTLFNEFRAPSPAETVAVPQAVAYPPPQTRQTPVTSGSADAPQRTRRQQTASMDSLTPGGSTRRRR